MVRYYKAGICSVQLFQTINPLTPVSFHILIKRVLCYFFTRQEQNHTQLSLCIFSFL